jgi:hypothetical protein
MGAGPPPKSNPHEQVAQAAVDIVEEVERDTGDEEAQAVLPEEKGIELAVDDEDTDDGTRGEAEEPGVEPREHKGAAGQGNEDRAQPLFPF